MPPCVVLFMRTFGKNFNGYAGFYGLETCATLWNSCSQVIWICSWCHCRKIKGWIHQCLLWFVARCLGSFNWNLEIIVTISWLRSKYDPCGINIMVLLLFLLFIVLTLPRGTFQKHTRDNSYLKLQAQLESKCRMWFWVIQMLMVFI